MASVTSAPIYVTMHCLSALNSLVIPTQARSSSSPTSADARIKYPSRRSNLLHSSDMAEPAQPLDVNTLHNVYVVEEVIQLTVVSDMEIIANSHWTEDLT